MSVRASARVRADQFGQRRAVQELTDSLGLVLEFVGPLVAALPQHTEPAEGDGALGGEEAATSGVIDDAEIGQEGDPHLVVDVVRAEVFDKFCGVVGGVAVADELPVHDTDVRSVPEPVEQVGVAAREDTRRWFGSTWASPQSCQASSRERMSAVIDSSGNSSSWRGQTSLMRVMKFVAKSTRGKSAKGPSGMSRSRPRTATTAPSAAVGSASSGTGSPRSIVMATAGSSGSGSCHNGCGAAVMPATCVRAWYSPAARSRLSVR